MLQMMRMSVLTVGVLVVALLAVTANAEAVHLQTDSAGEQHTLLDEINLLPDVRHRLFTLSETLT
jgi:hypothetical protein